MFFGGRGHVFVIEKGKENVLVLIRGVFCICDSELDVRKGSRLLLRVFMT